MRSPGSDEDEVVLARDQHDLVDCSGPSQYVQIPLERGNPVPHAGLMADLAVARHVPVDLVVPEKSNYTLVNWAIRPNSAPLLISGVSMWRSPPPFHHTKIMVVDDEWCLIGSCNWDVRSFRLNFELCMELYDQNLAAVLTALMRRCRGLPLTQADLDARQLLVRIRDASARLMLPYL